MEINDGFVDSWSPKEAALLCEFLNAMPCEREAFAMFTGGGGPIKWVQAFRVQPDRVQPRGVADLYRILYAENHGVVLAGGEIAIVLDALAKAINQIKVKLVLSFNDPLDVMRLQNMGAFASPFCPPREEQRYYASEEQAFSAALSVVEYGVLYRGFLSIENCGVAIMDPMLFRDEDDRDPLPKDQTLIDRWQAKRNRESNWGERQ